MRRKFDGASLWIAGQGMAALSAPRGGDALDAGVRAAELLGVGLALEGGEGRRGACGVPHVSQASSRSFGLDSGVVCAW